MGNFMLERIHIIILNIWGQENIETGDGKEKIIQENEIGELK
jgi:hypothetical protein